MNKRKLHHYWRHMRNIKPWYLLAVAVLFFVLGVWGLRQNNLQMIELRQAVITADEQGENVEEPLRELREFVYSRMNTNLSGGDFAIKPPIQLQGRYNRLVAEEEKKIEQHNNQVQNRAEEMCASRHPGGGFNAPRVACVQDYVAEHAKTAEDINIPEDLYKFDFVSPRWSPDFAGINLLLSGLFFVLFVVWLVFTKWARRYMR